jgi:putative two-component system response regulator
VSAPAADARPRVLVVDDTPENLELMHALLKEHYRVLLANGGGAGLRLAQLEPAPDLILLDIMMPELDGYAVCSTLKADPRTASIPVVFLTARTQVEDEERGFRCGCVDYITKPISPPTLLARVATHLALKASSDRLADNNRYLIEEVERRTHEVQMVQDVTIMAMASMAETRDNETGMHIRRTQNYVRTLAERLRQMRQEAHKKAGRESSYNDEELSDTLIETMYKSAPLHDIGKVGIPDAILLKPGPLNAAEFEIMKTHTTLGLETIAAAEKRLDVPSSFLSVARQIAYSHHERWDGRGYPQALSGEAIPLPARLMAVADVYDALISRRVYKEPFPHEQAVAMILDGSGSHFDPHVVAAFQIEAETFRAIAKRFQDE